MDPVKFTVADLRAITNYGLASDDPSRPVIFTFGGDTQPYENAIYTSNDPDAAQFRVFNNPNGTLEFHWDEELYDAEAEIMRDRHLDAAESHHKDGDGSLMDQINAKSARGLELFDYGGNLPENTVSRQAYDLFNEIDSLSTPAIDDIDFSEIVKANA